MSNGMSTFRNTMMAASLSLQFTNEVSQLISDFASRRRDNTLITLLGEHAEVGGKIDCQECKNFCVDDYVNILTKNSIPHFVIYEKLTGTPLVLTRDIDRDAVLASKNELLLRGHRITRLSHSEFIKMNQGKNVGIITSRSIEEAKLFQQYAWVTGMQNYSFKKSSLDPNKIDIFYSMNMDKRARLTIAKVAVAMTGIRGNEIRERLNYEIAQGNMLNARTTNAKDDFYVVSKYSQDHYIHFTEKGYEFFRKGAMMASESRTNPAFQESAKMLVSGISGAVVIEKQDFEASVEHRKASIDSKHAYYVPPAQMNNIEHMEQVAKEMIDTKLVFDNGSDEIPKEFFDPHSSFATFIQSKGLDHGTEELIKKLDAMNWEEKGLVKQYMAINLSDRATFAKKLSNFQKGDEIFVMSKSSMACIHINENGMTCYSGSGEKISSRPIDDRFFKAAAMSETRQFTNAMYLTREEMENPRQSIDQHAKVAGIENDRTAEIERFARMLVEKKMSLDNCEPPRILSDLYNPNISFNEYISIENANDETAQSLNKFIEGLQDKESILMKTYIEGCCRAIESIQIQQSYIAEKDMTISDILYDETAVWRGEDDMFEAFEDYDEPDLDD